MRIAFFTEGYDPFTNGVVVMLKGYRKALEEAGHEVVVFAPEHHGRPSHEDRVVRMPSLYWCKKTYPCLRPFAKNERLFAGGHFDIVHSHHPFSCGLLAEKLSRKHGIPLVYTFHTLLTNYSGYFPGARKVAEQGLMKILRRHCERADAVTVSTHIMDRWLRRKGIKSPIQVVRPPLTLSPAAPGARERMRRKLNIEDDAPLVLCASRLSLEKDVDFLVRAAKKVPEKLNCRFVLVGAGPQEEALRAEAAQLGLGSRLIFAGEAPHAEMPEWYAAADIFAFPSRHDTLGLVLVEAMAAGVPCVAVDQNGPTEVVRDGDTGFLVPFNERSFATGVAALAVSRNLREQMGEKARRWAHAEFGVDTALGLERAYETAKERFESKKHDRPNAVFGNRRVPRPRAKGTW